MTFSEFASKWGKDERFKGIESMRERERQFNDFIAELRKKEKEEKAVIREKVIEGEDQGNGVKELEFVVF